MNLTLSMLLTGVYFKKFHFFECAFSFYNLSVDSCTAMLKAENRITEDHVIDSKYSVLESAPLLRIFTSKAIRHGIVNLKLVILKLYLIHVNLKLSINSLKLVF